MNKIHEFKKFLKEQHLWDEWVKETEKYNEDDWFCTIDGIDESQWISGAFTWGAYIWEYVNEEWLERLALINRVGKRKYFNNKKGDK